MKLEERVMKVMKENMERPEKLVSVNDDLRKTLNLDSIGIMMVVSGLEIEFDIVIHQGDFAEISTVSDIATYLKEKYSLEDDHE